MIFLPWDAKAQCDEPGCLAEVPTRLMLGLGGGFMFESPSEPGWQLVVSTRPGRPGQPVMLRCPEHNKKVDTAGEKVVAFRTRY